MPPFSETIQDGKFVELTYQVTDGKTGHVLTRVEFPLGYVHGHNEILSPSVHGALAGRSAGEGSLVFSNEVDAVPPCGTDHGLGRSLLHHA